MAEKLKLQTNVPVTIALKFDEGKPMTGDYGDSVMYTLTDDRLYFAPPIVASKISALGVVRGEPFQLVKAEVTKGNRRTIEYQVSRVEMVAAAAAGATAAQGSSTTGATVAQPVQRIAPAQANSNYTNDSIDRGRDQAVLALTRAFEVAADALAASRSYNAKVHGWDTKYNEGNIISVAMSVYINAQKEGARWSAAA